MNIIKAGTILAAAALIAIGAGCKSTTEPSETDQLYFQTVVTGSDATTSDIATSDVAAMNDQEFSAIATAPASAVPSIQSVTDNGFVPLRWRRHITDATRSITRISMSGDSVAVVEVQVTFTGTLQIAGTLNGVPDTVSKPFTESMHRLFRFVKIAATKHPRDNWKLDAVSVLQGGTANSTIAITKIEVLPPTGDTLAVTDPDTYFMHVDKGWAKKLPMWGFNWSIVVNVTVNSSSPDTDYVFAHYVPKNNTGIHKNAIPLVSMTANGGTYTKVYSTTFIIPGNNKKFSHVVFSATTRATLQSADSTQIASSIWGVPYKTSE